MKWKNCISAELNSDEKLNDMRNEFIAKMEIFNLKKLKQNRVALRICWNNVKYFIVLSYIKVFLRHFFFVRRNVILATMVPPPDVLGLLQTSRFELLGGWNVCIKMSIFTSNNFQISSNFATFFIANNDYKQVIPTAFKLAK